MKTPVKPTKAKIVEAAWRLFYVQGYENTTIDEIVEESHTSRGSFYHYFESKDALLSSLSVLFDEKYEELLGVMDPEMSPIEKLVYMNFELFFMIENTVPVDLLSQLFARQLTKKGERNLLDTDRTYYKLLRQIAMEGQKKDVFRKDVTVNDITKAYAVFERGMMYDWCLSNGNYSLCQYASQVLPQYLQGFC